MVVIFVRLFVMSSYLSVNVLRRDERIQALVIFPNLRLLKILAYGYAGPGSPFRVEHILRWLVVFFLTLQTASIMLSRILITSCVLSVALSAPTTADSFLEPQQQLTFSNQAGSASSFSLPLLSSLSLPSDQLSQLKSHIEGLPERRLVQLNVAGEQVEISEGEKALLVYQGVKFVDVTDEVTFLTTQEKGGSVLFDSV